MTLLLIFFHPSWRTELNLIKDLLFFSFVSFFVTHCVFFSLILLLVSSLSCTKCAIKVRDGHISTIIFSIGKAIILSAWALKDNTDSFRTLSRTSFPVSVLHPAGVKMRQCLIVTFWVLSSSTAEWFTLLRLFSLSIFGTRKREEAKLFSKKRKQK